MMDEIECRGGTPVNECGVAREWAARRYPAISRASASARGRADSEANGRRQGKEKTQWQI